MNMTSVFAEITKTAPQEDGTLMVYGKATGSDLDLDGQRCDPAWLQSAMPEFMKIGNIREQHDAHRAVGKAEDHEVKDDGHYIRARIVDPVAIAKAKAGIFTGFSIGIKSPIIQKATDAPNGLIAGGNICEISLVDRPALPTATLTVCKAAKPGMSLRASDFDAQRMLIRVEELIEKTSDSLNKASDMTVTLADSLSPEQAEALTEQPGDVADKAVDAEVKKDAGSGCGCCDQCSMGADKSVDSDKVEDILAKVDNGLGDDESGDISGAEQAIAIIATLIQSEAKNLATAPAQGCDIDLLMQAVHALCWFKKREEAEQGGLNPAMVGLAADADLEKDSKEPYGDVEYADPGYQKDGKKRYPIDTEKHVRAALSYINQGDNAAEYSSDDLKKVKARIMAAAKKFDIDVDSKKSVEADESVTEEVVETSDKAVEAAAPEGDEAVDKTAAPEATKAAVEDDGETLVKALSAALEKADSPLRKSFEAIVESSTKSVAKAVTDVTARLEKVEAMATPGGPALRRTEVANTQSRKTDLANEVMRYKALASTTDDLVLRTGYTAKAASFEAELKSL